MALKQNWRDNIKKNGSTKTGRLPERTDLAAESAAPIRRPPNLQKQRAPGLTEILYSPPKRGKKNKASPVNTAIWHWPLLPVSEVPLLAQGKRARL